jgi:hypothetical protein
MQGKNDPLECQRIRARGGALPCCNTVVQKKGSLEIWKIKVKTEKCTKAGKMYTKKQYLF